MRVLALKPTVMLQHLHESLKVAIAGSLACGDATASGRVP